MSEQEITEELRQKIAARDAAAATLRAAEADLRESMGRFSKAKGYLFTPRLEVLRTDIARAAA